MKNLILILAFAALTSMTVISSTKNNATVKEIKGVSVFIYSTPVAEYSRVQNIELNGLMSSHKISNYVDAFIVKGEKLRGKNKLGEYDGIIIENDLTGTYIKFNE